MKKSTNKKLIILLTAALLVVGGAACAKSSGKPSGDDTPAIAFVDKRVELILGETSQLSLILEKNESVTYTSNDENVVKVSESGLVEGVGIGTAVVKATTAGGESAFTQIIVHDPLSYPVPHISVALDEIKIAVGERFTVEYAYTYFGETLDSAVEMSCENENVATVEDGVLCGVGVGSTELILRGESAYGTAMKKITVTVAEATAEFYLYPALMDRDIYVGDEVELALYVNDKGSVSELENVSFSVENGEIATVNNNILRALTGGDTTVVADFTYNGETLTLTRDMHVYGTHTCTFKYTDGTVDKTVDAVYGDKIDLVLENEEGNPEYEKKIKCWYVDGVEYEDEFFAMPDYDVEVLVRFTNDTKDDFTSSFTTPGHLLNDLTGKIEFVKGVLTDSKGNSSDLGGYVNFITPSWASNAYNFDEAVEINNAASVKMRIYMPTDTVLLYLGTTKDTNYNAAQPTKKYEISNSIHRTGDVPVLQIAANEWVEVELPLSAFGNIGEKIKGIAIAAAQSKNSLGMYVGGNFYIDYISVNYGLETASPKYDDKLTQAILAEVNGSAEQLAKIEEYRAWSSAAPDTLKAGENHLKNVATINGIIDTYFTQPAVTTKATIPTAQGTAQYCGDENNCPGHGHNHLYKTSYKHYYLSQFVDTDANGDGWYDTGVKQSSLTLPAMDYSAYVEVSFGFFVNSTQTANVGIDGHGVSLTNTHAHNFKITIKEGGYLVLSDDSTDRNNGGTVLMSFELSADVYTGKTGLVFDFETFGFTQSEFTESYLKARVAHVS